MPKFYESKNYLTIALEKLWAGLRQTRFTTPRPFAELPLDLAHLKLECASATIIDIATF